MTVENTAFLEFPFPLRKGQLAYLKIPPNITREEIERLGKFMTSLIVQTEEKEE